MVDRVPVDLARLMAAIRERTEDRPLENLTAARETAEQLAELGDAVIGAFVEEARAVGLSWTQIGTSLGVTRQAAQQRYVVVPPRVPAAADPEDRLPEQRAPFAAVRQGDDGIEVRVEIGGAWYQLVELDGLRADELVAESRRQHRARWFKRLSEDLGDIYAGMGRVLGPTAEVVLADVSGRRLRRTTEVTKAKRTAAWRFNNDR